MLRNTVYTSNSPLGHMCLHSPLSGPVFVRAKFLQSCLTVQPYGLQPTRLFCPWDSPGMNIGVGCHALLQGIFLTQGLDPHFLISCTGRQVLYHQCHLWPQAKAIAIRTPPLNPSQFSLSDHHSKLNRVDTLNITYLASLNCTVVLPEKNGIKKIQNFHQDIFLEERRKCR